MKSNNTTKEKIRYVAFRHFLEKGYEATNIREICKEVNIKASSLYFYYESKKDLFLNVYDEICWENLMYLKKINDLAEDTLKSKLFNLYKRLLEYYTCDIVKQKFLLRYHLFPPEEIAVSLREKFKYWSNEENGIILNVLKQCSDGNILSSNRTLCEYLQEYKHFINYQLTEIIIFNIKLSDEDLEKQWLRFWNGTMVKDYN